MVASSSPRLSPADARALRSPQGSVGDTLKSMTFVNSMIFPAPPSSYGGDDLRGTIEWAPSESCAGQVYPMAIVQWKGATRVIVYFHGNAEDIGDCLERLSIISRWTNCHVVAVEYPGYGPTRGAATEASTISRALEALRYVCSVFSVPLSKIVLYGRSIGTGIAAQVARQCKDRIEGLILQSPFESVKKLAQHHTWKAMFISDRFDTVAAMREITSLRVLVYHGKWDAVIPPSQGEAVYKACGSVGRRKTLIVDKFADHKRFTMDTLRIALCGFMWDLDEDRAGKPGATDPLVVFPTFNTRLDVVHRQTLAGLEKEREKSPTPEVWAGERRREDMTEEELQAANKEIEDQIMSVFLNPVKKA